MSNQLKTLLIDAVRQALKEHGLADIDILIEVDNPKEKKFGDWSLNIAMKTARYFKKSPLKTAEILVQDIKQKLEQKNAADRIEKIEIKPPGFINVFLSRSALNDVLESIIKEKDDYGRTSLDKQEKILIEFVSANPTGPLSIAHARQAAVGDSLAAILEFCGQSVSREYYINDEGNQIRNLGLSLLFRYKELLGKKDTEFPEQGYKGDYLVELAREFIKINGDKYLNDRSEETVRIFSEYAAGSILRNIEGELAGFGVRFDRWFSQKDHITADKIESVLSRLRSKKLIYESEGATWFKSTEFGDDKDRVIVKSDGLFTYLTPDIAYHNDKFERGFDKLIDILGPDHHGYINRIKAAACALGHERDDLEVLIIQLATLSRAGKPVKMSTRAGEYITLTELTEEVGVDAARFFFLMRRCDSQLDFDLELAKKHTMDNPVYYVQYAHARISSIFEALSEHKSNIEKAKINYDLISEPESLDLIRKMNQFSDVLIRCAITIDPQAVTTYLRELASDFHSFYNKCRVCDESNWELTRMRMLLIGAVGQVLRNGLKLLGVSAPAKM